MIIKVKVVPKASRALVTRSDGGLKVYLTRPAQDGLANRQLIELLAQYFKVKKYQLEIVKGDKSRDKIVEIAS